MTQPASGQNLREPLRRMLAVLHAERQALAGLDLDGVLAAAADKSRLCEQVDRDASTTLDEECLALLESARRLNEINLQVRNLIAANVSARLDTLAGAPALYQVGQRSAAGYAYAGSRG